MEIKCADVSKRIDERDVDLIFADPPFNIGQGYSGYSDDRTASEFSAFQQDWIRVASNALRPGGILFVHIPTELLPSTMAAAEHNQLTLWDNIVWFYRFGQNSPHKFARCHVHGLFFVRPSVSEMTWHPQEILVPSLRSTKYDDPRTRETMNPGKRMPLSVWDEFPRVQGNNKERIANRPNQLPEAYVARVLKVASSAGGLVVDMFVGSGTTAVVADALGRRFVGYDLDPAAVNCTMKRVERGAVRDL